MRGFFLLKPCISRGRPPPRRRGKEFLLHKDHRLEKNAKKEQNLGQPNQGCPPARTRCQIQIWEHFKKGDLSATFAIATIYRDRLKNGP